MGIKQASIIAGDCEINPEPSRFCANCKWYVPGKQDGGQHGSCHRGVPHVDEFRGRKRTLFPQVSTVSFCGEWQESNQMRLCVEGRCMTNLSYYWVLGMERTQSFDTRGAAIEAEGLETLEWRPLD